MGNFDIISTPVSIISMVLGGILLLTSSLFLDDWREIHAHTHCYFGFFDQLLCKQLDFYVTAASFGIIASVFQIASLGLAWKKQWFVYCILHFAISICCIIGFSLAIDSDVHKVRGYADQESRAKAFLSFMGIDMIFALVTAAGLFIIPK